MSKTEDRSRRTRRVDLDLAYASQRVSATVSRAVSVDCVLLKPDWNQVKRRMLLLRCC